MGSDTVGRAGRHRGGVPGDRRGRDRPRRHAPRVLPRRRPTDGRFLITAVYESKEACDRFVGETLMPLMPIDGGLVGPPEERGAEIVTAS